MNTTCPFLAALGLTATLAAAPASQTNSVGMRLIAIPAGEFLMGQDSRQTSFRSPWSVEKDRGADWDEQPAHRVRLMAGLRIGATEVTNAQYEQFESAHRKRRPKVSAGDDDAVVQVSWNDAVRFCAWLSAKEGVSYRLPTEAEWEYACRAGTSTLFAYGDELPAKYQPIVPGHMHAYSIYFRDPAAMPAYYQVQENIGLRVGQRPPNAWGLFDLHGNVEEWVQDWYGPYDARAQVDPVGLATGQFRVTRGGAYSQWARLLRSANRAGMIPDLRNDTIGFRVVQAPALPQPAPVTAAAPRALATAAEPTASAPNAPAFFRGPLEYVQIPLGSMGPVFSKHNHDPALTVCPNGDLLAIWYTCEEEPGSELAVVSSRLPRGASEWTPAEIFWDIPDRNDHGPALWWDGGQTLYHFNGLKQLPGSIVRTSNDNGYTWSAPRVFSLLTQANEAVLRTRDGRILASLDGPFQTTALEASADRGASWQSLSSFPVKPALAPGGSGPAIAGIHAGVVELRDGQLFAFGRLDQIEVQKAFSGQTPISRSADGGRTWHYSVSPFRVISSSQRLTLKRLREGPILLCSFTEERVKKDDFGRVIGGRPLHERRGATFTRPDGTEFTGHGLFAALSYDEGRTWPVRRVITPGGAARLQSSTDGGKFTLSETEGEPSGYLAMAQAPDLTIHLISSRNHYRFNLAWLTAGRMPPAGQ